MFLDEEEEESYFQIKDEEENEKKEKDIDAGMTHFLKRAGNLKLKKRLKARQRQRSRTPPKHPGKDRSLDLINPGTTNDLEDLLKSALNDSISGSISIERENTLTLHEVGAQGFTTNSSICHQERSKHTSNPIHPSLSPYPSPSGTPPLPARGESDCGDNTSMTAPELPPREKDRDSEEEDYEYPQHSPSPEQKAHSPHQNHTHHKNHNIQITDQHYNYEGQKHPGNEHTKYDSLSEFKDNEIQLAVNPKTTEDVVPRIKLFQEETMESVVAQVYGFTQYDPALQLPQPFDSDFVLTKVLINSLTSQNANPTIYNVSPFVMIFCF